MTPAETVTYLRGFADRQQDFASPAYTQNTAEDRAAFLHCAKMLRLVADHIERESRMGAKT